MTIQRWQPFVDFTFDGTAVANLRAVDRGSCVLYTDHLAAIAAKDAELARERECRVLMAKALRAVVADRKYQRLSGGAHFSSAQTEYEMKQDSSRKAWKLVDAALLAAKEIK